MENIISYLKLDEKNLIKYKKLCREQILFNEGDKCEFVGIVISGNIDIISYTFDGKEILYNSLFEGGVFGNNLIFSNHPFYKGNIIAKSESQLALIKKDDLVKILQNNKQFLVKYLEIQSDFAKSANDKIKLLSFDSAEERLMFILKENGNKIVFKNITSLANILSMKRETLSRLISRLEKEGKIKKNLHSISRL